MGAYDVIIIGAGSAGYTAAIYATRYGMKTLLIGKEPGGQSNEAFGIDNYPGFLNVSGLDLMTKFKDQAEKLGAEMLAMEEATGIKKKGSGFLVKAGGKDYECKSVILATGSRRRKLGIPGEKELSGKGVAYCATCDAMFFRDKTVMVIGGGDSAVKSALLLAEHAKRVYLVYRRGKENLRSMPSWLKKLDENRKIEKVFHSAPKEIRGKDKIESVVFDQKGRNLEIKTDGVFIEIGTIPETELAENLGVKTGKNGKIDVGPGMETNVKGFFAAGDITNGSNGLGQIITACSEGAIAAESAYNYVKK